MPFSCAGSGNIEQTLAIMSSISLIFENDFYDFEASRRCPLGFIILHRHESSERTLAASNLFSLPVGLYLKLFKVSVRYLFPAWARGKCYLTDTILTKLSMPFQAHLRVSVRHHFRS